VTGEYSFKTAKRLECDEDKEQFEKRLGKIVKAKPQVKI